MKPSLDYFTATTQTHVDHLEREREATCAKTWEEEQKRRRSSLDEHYQHPDT